MSNVKPITRGEAFLARAAGQYIGELPEPVTREEYYWKKIIERIEESVVTPEEIDAAIEAYLNSHDADIVTEAELTDALDGKQDVLTFDSAPTQSSTNPVTSGGVYTALANVGSPTAAQVQTAVDNYLDNSGVGTLGTMQDFKNYVMGE